MEKVGRPTKERRYKEKAIEEMYYFTRKKLVIIWVSYS